MKYYLAYGSNLNKTQMVQRCPDAVPVGTAMIHNCRLEFRRGFLTIEPDETGSVPVGVWQISDADEKALDRYEGFPKFYYKKNLRVMTDARAVINAMVYIMTDGHPIKVPSDPYFYTVLRGYRDFGIKNREMVYGAYQRAKWPEDEENEGN